MPTYWVKSGSGGTDAGTSWANAAESLEGLWAAQAIAGGDIIYVHNTHSYLKTSAGYLLNLPEATAGQLTILCVDGGDPTGASLVDGTVGNLTTGAVEGTNANCAFTLNSAGGTNFSAFIHGISFQTGSGGSESAADLSLGISNQGRLTFSACSFFVNSTSSGAGISCGDTSFGGSQFFINCSFKFGSSSNFFNFNHGRKVFTNCWVDTAGASPTILFTFSVNRAGAVECYGCDWSYSTAVVDLSAAHLGYFRAANCAISTPTSGTVPSEQTMFAEFLGCAPADGTNGADILSYYYEDYCGVVEDDQSIYLTTGGAVGKQDDGTDTPYSLAMKPTANASKTRPLYTPWIYTLVSSTGDKTVTMKACDAGSDADELHTSELWMEVEYMGEPGATGTQRLANSPHTQMEVDDDCPVISGTIYRDVIAAGADRTDTDEAWTGIAETNTYTLTASINVAEVGYIRCRVGLAFDRDVYVDPKIGVA